MLLSVLAMVASDRLRGVMHLYNRPDVAAVSAVRSGSALLVVSAAVACGALFDYRADYILLVFK